MKYDGTNADAVRAQARAGRIYVVAWTWRQHEILPTKKACRDAMRAWREQKEMDGFAARSYSGGESYWADHPDGRKECITLQEYDANTLERIVKLPPLKPYAKPDPKPSKAPKKPRRGRKPVGV